MEGMGRYVDGGDGTHIRSFLSNTREGHPLLCGASNEVTSTRNGLWNDCRTPLMATLVQPHLAPLSKPQQSALGFDSVEWYFKNIIMNSLGLGGLAVS